MRTLPDVVRNRNKSISLSLRSFSESFDWLVGYEDNDILEHIDQIPQVKPMQATNRKDLDKLIGVDFVIKLNGVWYPARIDRKLQIYPILENSRNWVTIPDKSIVLTDEINVIFVL